MSRKKTIYVIIMLFLGAGILFCGGAIKMGQMMDEENEQLYSGYAEPTTESNAEDDAETEYVPVHVDWSALRKKNNEVVGWVWVDERPLMKALSCNLNIDLSKYDPNAEVDSEYIAMISKMMALLRQEVVKTNFEAKAQAESLKAKKFARHFGRKATISITRLMKELDLLSSKEIR